jgi:hypothetical protein
LLVKRLAFAILTFTRVALATLFLCTLAGVALTIFALASLLLTTLAGIALTIFALASLCCIAAIGSSLVAGSLHHTFCLSLAGISLAEARCTLEGECQHYHEEAKHKQRGVDEADALPALFPNLTIPAQRVQC